MNASPLDVAAIAARDDPEGPGSQLREARHRARLSLEEVSTELHLNTETIRALEENCYEELPAPAFIRGYIRSYARLLILPPGPILEAYDLQGFTPPTIVPDIAQQPQAKSTDVPMRLATYLVAAGLVVMVVMWWHSREAPLVPPEEIAEVVQQPVQKLPTTAAPATDALIAGSAASPGEPEIHDSQTRADDPLATDALGPVAAISEAVADVVDPAPPGLADSRDEEPAAATALAPLAAIRDEIAMPGMETIGATSDEAEAVSPRASAGSHTSNPRLDLAFDKESWLEIYDGKGGRLVYRLATEGERVTLDAEPPIRVVLGYAAGARITFNGRDVDFSPFMQRGMARFVVAADGAARAPASSNEDADGQATAAAVPGLQPQN